jgi:uncharacterized membrane protein
VKLSANLYFILLSLLTLPAVIYSYLKIVFLNDVYILFGSSILADGLGVFPSNIDTAWETRPLGNRIVFYLLYKVCEPLYGNDFLFQVGTKAVVAVIIIAVCWYFAVQVCKHLKELNVYAVFLLTTVSLFTAHLMILLTTEHFAVIFTILAISLLLSKNKYANILSGGILLFIILLKMITIILIPMAIISVILITKEINKTKLYYCIVGFIISILMFTIMCAVWFKHFISDSLLIIILHNPGYNTTLLVKVQALIFHSLGMWWFIPVSTVGVISAVIVLYEFIKTNNRLYAAMFIVLWVCPLVSVLIQYEWAPHHYTALILCSTISILLSISTNYKKYHLVAVTVIILFILIAFGMTSSIWQDTHEHMWDNNIHDANIMKQSFGISDQSDILYADVGISAYFVGGIPSACRETYPWVIRSGYKIGLANEPAYLSAKKCIMDYSGKYILYDGAITDPDISTKITAEYIKVYNGTYWHPVYPPTDLYQRRSVT